jgi:hypothetical protein
LHLFNFSATLSWRVTLNTNPEEILANGDIVLEEFNQDDFQEIEVALFQQL